jgi:hypothetical protein
MMEFIEQPNKFPLLLRERARERGEITMKSAGCDFTLPLIN